MMDATTLKFSDFLQHAFDQGNYATDDVIAFITPLIEEIISFHETGMVAPFEQPTSLFINQQRLDINENLAHRPTHANAALKQMFVGVTSKNFDITGAAKLETEVAVGQSNWQDLQIHLSDEKPTIPAYIKGYQCFEMTVGHHDAQTDIFCVGLILGSMALSLDLNDTDDLTLFVQYRTNPVQYNQRIHPTISALITEMTDLDRHKRTQDLYDVLHRLQHYRDYDPEKQTDLSSIPGWVNKALTERHQLILNKLRNRLFDTSRRNRLLYYKPNARFVNLTVSSVPTVLHYQSIRPELLFTWNEDLAPKITGAKELILNKYLRFEDHTYLPSSLDKIRVESQRDIQEFGFSQLKLVIAFLNWHNLKEVADERIQSPLLLMPVELKRNKRLKEDHYHLKVLDSVAEVNPVLANQLRELYGIQLPDFVDLEEMSPEQFYQLLKLQIDQANQGIQLHYISKPRIKLIHSVAKQTVNNYKRRMNNQGGRLNSYKQMNYSYEATHYQPLGLEIFKQRIQSKPSVLEFLVNEDIKHAQNNLTGADSKERALYELTDSENNPYSWDVDMCNMVLGNFNYKKMSLVRDYNQVIDQQLQHDVFESLFSTQPKKLDQQQWPLNNPDEWHHVITADPTQTNAILQSRTGESYIIQGPPGTGKSQTITNLIADFVARGKKVLFVCEKRAALDVVFHRLKQNGLDELCSYIHDSQGDKRTFIKNLKDTYEDFSKNRMDLSGIRFQRNKLLQQLQAQLQTLEHFHQTHLQIPDDAGVEVRQLIQRLIHLKDHHLNLSPQEQELLPGYAQWLRFGDTIQQLCDQLEDTGADAALAQHPLSKLNDAIFNAENPLNLTDSLLQTAQQVLQDIQQVFSSLQVPPQHAQYLHQIKSLIQDAVLLQPLAEHDNLKLAVPGNTAAKEFDKKIRQYKKLQQQAAQQQAANENWTQKFSANDAAAALEIARKHEQSFFKFLNGNWRKLKQQVQTSYDFSKHQVKPTITALLEQLQAEYASAQELMQHQQNLLDQYRLTNIDITCMGIDHIRAQQGDPELTYLLSHPEA
ncbi:MAG: hypothetical protein RLY16_16, partial [Bacteroidota bacterium]